MNPYNEIDLIVNSIDYDCDTEEIRDRLYTILEETIEAARRGEYAD